jgi:kumamolisin
MSTHVAVKGSERVPLAGARPIGPANARAVIDVAVKLRRKRKLPDLRGRPKVFMTRKALAAKYGASKRDVAKVIKEFGKYGLQKVYASAATRTVGLRGTVAQLENAFRTKLST